MSKFTVVYERDEDGALIAEIKEVSGCHTYGRSVREARRNVLDALSLWLQKPVDEDAIVEDWSRIVDPPVIAKLDAARQMEAQVRQLPVLRAEISQELLAKGFSRRDAGWIVGIAHQRVQQYAHPRATARARAKPASARRASSGRPKTGKGLSKAPPKKGVKKVSTTGGAKIGQKSRLNAKRGPETSAASARKHSGSKGPRPPARKGRKSER